jgi:peptide deformylase
MALLTIEMLGAEVLRRRAAEVVEIDEDLRVLVEDMFETMYAAEGIGLAGPQVGVSRRVLVVDVHQESVEPFALINPCVIESSRETDKADEGCLSIPGVAASVERPTRVVVEGLNTDGACVHIEAEGLLARCLQHEVDHLDGVLFIDRISPLKRRMVLQKYKRGERDNPSQGKPAEPGAQLRR